MAKLLGIDIHRYYRNIDPRVAYDAGARFALIRAGGCDYYGHQYEDNYFKRNAEVFPEHMPIGFWYVFRPNHSPEKQAESFIELVRDVPYQVPCQFDVELWGEVSPRVFADNLLMAYAMLDAAFPNSKHINYTRAEFFNKRVAQDPRWALYDLWIARYTTQPKPWGNQYDQPYVYPRDWESWVFWQWSADYNNRGPEFGVPPDGDDDIDLDWFNGDQAAFNAKFNIGQVEMPYMVEVTTTKNTLGKAGPKGINEHVIPLGTRLGVVGQDKAADGSIWYNVGGMWILADHVKVIE